MVILGLYLGLHLALGSSPVQHRVVEEIRKALSAYGIDLQIESIEFSAFTPKIYLNRVTLRSLPHAKIQLVHPLPIDKIKIEFQPLALISKRLVIEEAILFHPRLIIPRADLLYKKIEALTASRKPPEFKGGTFNLVLKKVGVVDALFDIDAKDPNIAIRSHSLSAFVENSLTQQQNLTIVSRDLEVERGDLKLHLNNVDVDIDLTKKSMRVNRAVVEGDQLSINLKGASSVPNGGLPSSLTASFDVRVPLALLNRIPELKTPQLDGVLASQGTVMIANGSYEGNGSIRYQDIMLDGYKIGRGSVEFGLTGSKVSFTEVNLKYGGGELTSKLITIGLSGRYPLAGDLTLHGVRLDGILDSVKNPGSLVRLSTNGPMAVKGDLAGPLEIHGDLNGNFTNFAVINKYGKSEKDTIVAVDAGTMQTNLNFYEDKMTFNAHVALLGGTLDGQGYVGYDNIAKVKAQATHLSLTGLGHVAQLSLAGVTDLTADVDVAGSDAKILGNFTVSDAAISKIYLGSVRGQAYYQNQLLSFENLEAATTMEPVKGNGFVDFNPDKTHYKFSVEGKRLGVDDAFKAFGQKKLKFAPPKGGEVSARMSIEGGHDDEGMEVIASGQAKNFKWYDEDWLSSSFFATFRTNKTDISRLVLLKKSGGLDIRGHFGDDRSRLSFLSHGLRVEELNHIGRSPLSGEILGEVVLEGQDLTEPSGTGDITLTNATFRDNPLPPSHFKIKSDGQRLEIVGNLLGEKLNGSLIRDGVGQHPWTIQLSFEEFDFTPFTTVLLGKDIPTVNEITATGDINLKGSLSDWSSFKGGGKITTLNLGLKGTPMKNQEPIVVDVDNGAIKVSHASVIGKDSQLAFDVAFEPEKSIQLNLDGKLDLQFVQPFVPGLEYGSGKLSAAIRVSGTPRNFNLLGNISLEDGTFRMTGINDEFKSAQMQLSLSQDRINVDHFESTLNGGLVTVEGDVHVNKFESLIPNLRIAANRVVIRTGNYLTTRLSGEFTIKGNNRPYELAGKCRLIEGNLTRFDVTQNDQSSSAPLFTVDVSCESKDKLLVTTDVMNAEFKGNFHLVGNNVDLGLLGSSELIQGSILFRERKFTLNSGNVKFESSNHIAPRFAISGRAMVQESVTTTQVTQAQTSQQYEVNLTVTGTPTNYKILLTSTPELAEADIISLLLLGVTSKREDGNYLDLGSTLVGQIPLQSKIESQLGLDIRFNTQSRSSTPITPATAAAASVSSDITVPAVKIQKDITNRTKVSYSNTLEAIPFRELKIEHMLDDNYTINGTAVDGNVGGTDTTTTQSYGIDIRYRFSFE